MESGGKLWGGRFSGDVTGSDVFNAVNQSIHVDKRLWKEELLCSLAYSRALAAVNIISHEQLESIFQGLRQVITGLKINCTIIKYR